MSNYGDPTGSVRNVAADDDLWERRDRTFGATGTDEAIEGFFAAEPEVTARELKRAGAVRTEKRGAPRYEARKVRRLVRHVEPWSVLKVSLLFYFCLWAILLVAGALLWRVADSSGIIGNIESFVIQVFVLDTFEIDGRATFRIYAIGGLVGVVAMTVFTVVLALLFNLISDLTGGVRVTVLEEESARPVARG